MWNAFGNGSGLHGGGGGYVGKTQGWEFVPCSRLERERGRGKSPLRTLSPSIPVGNFYEQPIPGLGVAGASESSRGQVPRNESQTQHTRLKKKIEDLKKRHGQDKEEWMREKEVLLRQMADIQGGENRRILLDLKSILDEVQLEVKREETKRSELQLEYMKDRCAWELERAELKCRIAQLEVREHCSPEAPVAKTSEEPVGGGGIGGSTLRREQQEQKRLLADTHTVAMDLRCRLEHCERGWLRERSELLERFNLERKEWESQLRDMQRKIEELYNEVRSRREPGDVGPNAEAHSSTRFSMQSASTGSSVLTDPSDVHSSSYSDSTHRHSQRPGGGGGDLSGRLSNSHNNSSSSGDSNSRGDGVTRSGARSGAKVDRRTPTFTEQREIDMVIDTAELEDILQGCLGQKLDRHPSLAGQEGLLNPFSDLQSMDIRCGTDKRNAIALNAALKEIARVSEELCSYQDEIRRKSDGKSHTESLYFPDELERMENERNKMEMDETFFSLNQWCKELQGIDEQSWIRPKAAIKETNVIEPDISIPPMKSPDAPPVPPRSTSWYMNSPPPLEAEFTAPEPHVDRKCPSPCVHLDKKCNSPSIVRKFEAMLQENEGKILTDSGIIPCVVPANSKCNISCCHSRWSCDGSRFGSSKSSTYVPVQKCLSELNIPSTGVDYRQDHKAGTQKGPGEHLSPLGLDIPGKDTHGDARLPTLDILPTQDSALAPRRNLALEQKTAEFNRTLFQAEMGRGFQNEDGLNPTDVTPSITPQQHPEVKPREVNVDIMSLPRAPEVKRKDRATPTECHIELKYSNAHYAEMELEEAMFELPVQYHEATVKQVVSELVPQGPVVRVRDMIHPSTRSPPETKLRTAALNHHPEGRHEREVTSFSSEQSVTAMAQLGVSVTVTPIQSRNKVESPSVSSAGPAQRPLETRPKPAESTKPDAPKTRSRILNDNPWKPTTLAAYPRPVDSRSNYGAIERILKSYECSSPTQTPAATASPGKEDDLIELMDMLNVEHHARSSQRLTHTTQRQATTHKETHVTVQKSKESGMTSRKSFSRPACPANRRLPSRWASRSPSASSTSSSSTSSSPITQLSAVSTQKQTFSYAAFHTETVII